MRIRVGEGRDTFETTLAKLLEALEGVTNNDKEIEAVLVSMLDGDRIHFAPEPALAA